MPNRSDEEMRAIRRQEQNAAAVIGEYGVTLQLDFPSISNTISPSRAADVRDRLNRQLKQ